MCEPTTIMTALAIASSTAAVVSQREMANAQIKTTNAAFKQRAEEIAAQQSQQVGERVKELRREQARMRVAAGEAGIAGVSFENALLTSLVKAEDDVGVINKNTEYALKAAAAGANSALAGVQKPTALSAGLQIASAAYTGWGQGQQIEANRQKLSIPTN